MILERKFVIKKRRNANGEMEDHKEYLTFNRVDGWFICIAPLENPQLAIAVLIEDIGNQFGGGLSRKRALEFVRDDQDVQRHDGFNNRSSVIRNRKLVPRSRRGGGN